MKIATDEDCFIKWKALKFDSAHRFITFKVEKEGAEKIVIETVGERELDWTAFLACLPAEDYRYAVFDLEFTTGDGLHHKKPFFCFWAPDAAPLKNRMLYATAKENFKAELDTLGKDITLCSKDELNFEQLCKEFDK